MAGDLPELDFHPMNMLDVANQRQGILEQQQLGPLQIATKRQELETQNALAPFKVQQAGYEAQNAKEESALKQQDYENQMMAAVAQRASAADPQDAPQIWDEGMQALAGKGIGSASQYVGHYRPDLADKVYQTFGGRGATGGGTGAAGGASAGPPGFDAESFQRGIAGVPLPQLQKSLGNLNRAITGFNNVKDKQSWETELQALRESGIPVEQFLPSTEWNAVNYAAAHRAIQGLTAQRDMVANQVATMGVGLPAPVVKPAYEPSYQYIGTEQKTGRPITMNTRTGQGGVAYNAAIAPKPSAGMSTFMLKQNAWLSVHPGDQAGALEFANGKRRMDPGQMQAEALKLANQQLYDENSLGTPPANPDQWVREKARQNYDLISGAGASAGNGGTRGTLPAPSGARRMSQADVQASIAAARTALKRHPDKKGVILARLKAAGVPTTGL